MTLIRLPDTVLMQEVAGESLLLNLDSGHYFSLDAIGTRMLSLALAQADTESCVARLEREFDASGEQIRRDFEQLLESLHARGLTA